MFTQVLNGKKCHKGKDLPDKNNYKVRENEEVFDNYTIDIISRL